MKKNPDNRETQSQPRTAAADAHLRIMVEQMVRDGRTAEAIEAAVRRAA